jgi:hypothetical protein
MNSSEAMNWSHGITVPKYSYNHWVDTGINHSKSEIQWSPFTSNALFYKMHQIMFLKEPNTPEEDIKCYFKVKCIKHT